MNTPYYRKTGLPGLSGTHDKPSPIRWAFLAAIPKALIAAGKGVVTAAKVAGTKAIGALKGAGKGIVKGAKQFAGKDGFVSKVVDKVEHVGDKVKTFAEKNPTTYKAITGGVSQMKSGVDRGKAEIEQSVYANKQNEKENRSNFASMNFGGGGPLSRKIKKY